MDNYHPEAEAALHSRQSSAAQKMGNDGECHKQQRNSGDESVCPPLHTHSSERTRA